MLRTDRNGWIELTTKGKNLIDLETFFRDNVAITYKLGNIHTIL